MLITIYHPQLAMSPKKNPEITKSAVEDEIAVLAGESSSKPPQADLQPIQNLLNTFLIKQNDQQTTLLKTLTETSLQSSQAILSAVNRILPIPQRASTEAACPSQPRSSVIRQDLSSANAAEMDEEREEVEGDLDRSYTDSEIMHPDFLNFEGWDIPASGTTSDQVLEEVPTASTQPSTSTASASPIDDELFNMYGLPINWDLAPELISWLESVKNKEVPFSVLKAINESFVPKEEIQPFFSAPALPPAISRLIFTAPKGVARGPKILNTILLRVQKELCIAYKPLLEVLNFFYSEAYTFLIQTVPDLKETLASHKLQLSQSLAIIVSIALKVSKARKHALRPLLRYSSSNLLQQQPTSQHVLGSDDLATLSDRATKENKAIYGVFRQAAQNRSRYRARFQPYQRFRGSQFRSNYGYQDQASYGRNSNNYRRYNRGQSKKGRTTAPTSK